MNLLKLIMKRPEDKTIRLIKVLFGLALAGVSIAVYYQNLGFEETLFTIETTRQFELGLWIFIGILSVGPILSGVSDKSLLSRGHTRILQIVYGVLIILFGTFLNEQAGIGFEIFYPLLGIAAIIAGITGKLITTRGLKAKQKVTKIRV